MAVPPPSTAAAATATASAAAAHPPPPPPAPAPAHTPVPAPPVSGGPLSAMAASPPPVPGPGPVPVSVPAPGPGPGGPGARSGLLPAHLPQQLPPPSASLSFPPQSSITAASTWSIDREKDPERDLKHSSVALSVSSANSRRSAAIAGDLALEDVATLSMKTVDVLQTLSSTDKRVSQSLSAPVAAAAAAAEAVNNQMPLSSPVVSASASQNASPNTWTGPASSPATQLPPQPPSALELLLTKTIPSVLTPQASPAPSVAAPFQSQVHPHMISLAHSSSDFGADTLAALNVATIALSPPVESGSSPPTSVPVSSSVVPLTTNPSTNTTQATASSESPALPPPPEMVPRKQPPISRPSSQHPLILRPLSQTAASASSSPSTSEGITNDNGPDGTQPSTVSVVVPPFSSKVTSVGLSISTQLQPEVLPSFGSPLTAKPPKHPSLGRTTRSIDPFTPVSQSCITQSNVSLQLSSSDITPLPNSNRGSADMTATHRPVSRLSEAILNAAASAVPPAASALNELDGNNGEDSNVEELKVAPKQQQPTALESLLAPSNVSTEKQEISVGALETLLAPVVAAGAVGNIPTQIDGVLSDQSASDDESAHILSRSATPPAEILAGGGSGESFGVVPAGSLGATSLKPEFELPIRATTEFLSSRDPMLPAVMAKISAWPVRKSGFLFRKDLQPLRFPPNSSNYSSLFPNVRPTASTLSALSNSSNSSGKKYNIMSLLQRSSKSNIHIVNPDGGNSTNSVGAPGSSPAAGGIILDGRSPSITSTLSYPGNGLDDDDDWSLYYVEVRERYMFFYLVTPTAPSPQPQQQINVLPIVPENREETSVRRNSVTGGSSVFDSNRPRSQISFTSLKATAVGKPMGFNKIFDSLKRIKPGANVYSRPSSSDLRLRGKNPSPIPPAISQPSNIGQNVYQPPNSLGDRRSSADSSRSVWGNFTLNDIKSAPRVLVQYLPLHLSSLEYVFTRANGPIFQTFSDISPQPSSYPSFLSLSVRVGISSVLDTHPCGMEERIMLDIFEGLSWEWNNVAQPNQRPHGSIHTNDSITSVGSLSSRPSPELKKAELDEWVAAVRLASLLSFDPLVSTYETWEQTQMQAMRRVDTGASSVTAKASNASIGSLGTVRDSSGFMKRSLTKLSFGMAPDRTDIARSGAGRTSPLEGASSAASVKSNSAGNWWPGKRDSVIAVVNAGGDDGIYGSSPGADRSLSNKLSFPKILTAKPKREDSMSMMSVEPLKIEPVKINVSLTKRADSPNVNPTSPQQYTHSQQLQAHIRVGRGSNASNLYKPVDSSPLSPPQMATSKSSFSWRERGQSNPPIFTGSSVPPTQSTLSARVEHDAPLVDPGKLTLGRQRAASHSMLKSPAISTASPSPVAPVISESYRKWGLLGNKRSADVHDVTAKSATTAETNSKRTSGFAEIVVKKTPSRSFRFGGKPKGYESFMMRRTNTVASQSSSIRRVPTKQSNKDKKRYSAGTFVSMNGTVQTAIEWTDEVPLVLKKCIKLIEDIGLEVEGIYRLSGKVNVMNKLLGLFEEDATKVHLFPPPDVQVKASLASSPYIAESRRMSINSSTSSFDSAFPSFPTGSLSKVIAMGSSSANPERHRQGTGSGTAILLGRNSPVVTKPPKVEPQRGRLSKRDVLPASMSSSNLYDNDVHVVAGVVKAYLRKGLPPSAEPVTTVALHNAFVVAAKTADWRNRMIAIQDTVHQLPRENFQILKFICQHLKKVSTFSEINKMTVQNLSTIFAPNLFVSSLTDMQAHAMAVEIMIEYSDWVFSDPEYEKDETADRASDQASIMSEDEIYSDFKKSSGDIFDPNKYLRKQYGDLEKDSVGEVLDLIPHEDSSSQIPGDSVRGDEVSGHVFDGERRSNLGELEDDEVESYEEAFVVNGSGKGELSVTPQTNESVSVSGLGECGNRASSDVSVLQRFDGSNASFGWNADDSVPKSYDDKRLRRKMVVSTVLDSVNKLALSSPTLMVEVPDNLLPRERSIGGEEGFGGTSSHFGSSPESPTSMFGSSSRRSSMSRSRRLGSSSASGKQE